MKVNITISTGYFAQASSYKNPVAVTSLPMNASGIISTIPVCSILNPEEKSSRAFRRDLISEKDYTQIYWKQLLEAGRERILADLIKKARSFEFTLVSFNKGGKFDTRHLCRSYLTGQGNKNIDYNDQTISFEFDFKESVYNEIINEEKFKRKQFIEESKVKFSEMFSSLLDDLEKEIWK